MRNIIKALNYQMKRDYVTICFLLLICLIQIVALGDIGGTPFGEITGSVYALKAMEISYLLMLIVPLYFATRICGWDFNDKCINYELLAGKARNSVYLARAVLSMAWSVAVLLVVNVLPIIVFTLFNGWGCNVKAGELALRLLLSFFPVFRILGIVILLTFLLRNSYAALILGYLLLVLEVMAALLVEDSTGVPMDLQLAAANLTKILTISNYSMEYIDGKDEIVFRAAMESPEIVGTVLVSLVVGCVCLGLGYCVFRRQDMA